MNYMNVYGLTNTHMLVLINDNIHHTVSIITVITDTSVQNFYSSLVDVAETVGQKIVLKMQKLLTA